MSNRILQFAHRRPIAVFTVALAAMFAVGCQEWVHMGQVSDRDGAFSIRDARIDQIDSDGSWRTLGATDGNGRWWIMKERIKGGGRIRITKAGYHTVYMTESEFLQQVNLLMIPESDSGAAYGEGSQRSDPGLPRR